MYRGKEIFKPFIQFSNERASYSQSFGIGLPLAKTLAELHGGSLTLADGSETNFVLRLPVKTEENSLVNGLSLGADDYIFKPFGVMEFVSCIKAVLRRCRPKPEAQLLKVGDVVMNLDEHTVSAAGERITLTYKEFELLRLFLSHQGMAFTRDQLFNEVWGMDYCGETRTVDAHVGRIRKKLSWQDKIKTIPRIGYRLEVDL